MNDDELQLTKPQARRLVPTIEARRFDFLWASWLKRPDGGRCDVLDCVRLAAIEWLRHIGLSDAEQDRAALTYYSETRVSKSSEDWRLFTISDARYLSAPGWDRFYDIVTGVWLDKLTEETVSHYTCDLQALRRRTLKRAAVLAGANHEPVAPEAVQAET